MRADLLSGSTAVDSVGSYTGMRTIGLARVDGVLRPVLNGQFVFQTGTLDQGYWPDGIYTAPTDAALRFDLQKHKDLGFNMVRKHIKVEPQRWFYWADRLGLLVWQDMPSMERTPDAAGRAQWESEYRRVIDQHRSSPSLVMWVDQNEGWGQYDQARIANEVKAYDPSRLVDNMSGVNCCGAVDGGNGDVVDHHVYVGPGTTVPDANRAAVLGEYGGLGFKVAGHEWYPGGGFSYEDQPSPPIWTTGSSGSWTASARCASRGGLSAAVYTEITDVENEANGLLTYDRQVVKVDEARVRAANRALIDASRSPSAPVTLPTGQFRSLRVTTPGYTDRYVRHKDGAVFTEVVNGGSEALLKADATWRIVPGLADASCSSFESRNYPGEYLRHRDSRVYKEGGSGDLFRADATFCPVRGANGGVRLSAYNFPGSICATTAQSCGWRCRAARAPTTPPPCSPRTPPGRWGRPGHPERCVTARREGADAVASAPSSRKVLRLLRLVEGGHLLGGERLVVGVHLVDGAVPEVGVVTVPLGAAHREGAGADVVGAAGDGRRLRAVDVQGDLVGGAVTHAHQVVPAPEFGPGLQAGPPAVGGAEGERALPVLEVERAGLAPPSWLTAVA